jgi:hypothetical protein
MPTRNRPENALIELFLSAYDHDTWQNSVKEWLDERKDRAVELLATRASDGATLAIEHTLIQPYSEYKKEFARFREAFLPIQIDKSLIVRNRGMDVFVASGTLVEGRDWRLIATTVHDWLRGIVRDLPLGESDHNVGPAGSSQCRLLIRVQEVPDYDGDFRAGIDGSQLPHDSLGSVVETALTTKLPKLVETKANRLILLLERDEPTLSEDRIAKEIERKRHAFPELSKIDEVWFVDTSLHGKESDDFVMFSTRKSGQAEKILKFYNGRLHRRYGT